MAPFVRPAAIRQGDRLVASSAFLILLALFAATMTTWPDIADSEVEFQTTRSLVLDESLALGDTPEAEAIINAEVGGRQGFDVHRGGPGREHEWFSWFGVGQAYVGVPFYALGAVLHWLFPEIEERHRAEPHMDVHRSEYFEHLMVGLRNPLLSAATAWLIVLSACRLGASRRHAWIAGLAYGLTTFAWPQARSTLSGVQATFFLFLAFHCILKAREAYQRFRHPSPVTPLLCGLALGAAFLTRVLTAPVVAVLGLTAVLVIAAGNRRLRSNRWIAELSTLGAPALACVAVFLWTNLTRFGDPFETGYGEVVTWESYFNYPLHLGLSQILLTPGQGLLWMAPGVILSLLWFFGLTRDGDRWMRVVVLAVAAAVLVPPSLTAGWHGAWGYGPRYALPLLPFLWVGVGLVLDLLVDVRFGRVLAGVLFLFGTTVALAGVLVDHTTHTDLAVRAARIAWPDVEGVPPADQEEERFQRIRRDFRFAAPWAHWRILRHRVAEQGEEFPVREIFLLDDPTVLTPEHEREKEFRHLAWVDFAERLEGPTWPAALGCVLLLASGLIVGVRGLDPNLP